MINLEGNREFSASHLYFPLISFFFFLLLLPFLLYASIFPLKVYNYLRFFLCTAASTSCVPGFVSLDSEVK